MLAGDRMKVRPEQVDGWEPSEQERAVYESQKLIVKSARLKRQKNMQIKKPHENIARAISLLRPFMRGLSHYDQTRFIGYICNEASKKQKK